MMNPDVCGTFETTEEEDSDDIPLVVQDLKDKTTVGNVGNALGRSQQERLEQKEVLKVFFVGIQSSEDGDWL